uniref:CCHC-type domain-containing protein n=1 Tax=Spongospora subterranea TaxID=70186 RepID=A0A0H5QT83_9EUKA|eukprot:CRZ04922.1 hypothetical protein [Spongospora subterranea]
MRSRICYRCHERGHIRAACPKKEQVDAARTATNLQGASCGCGAAAAAPTSFDPGGLQRPATDGTILVEIENQSSTALIDTGVDVSLIRRRAMTSPMTGAPLMMQIKPEASIGVLFER